MQLLPKLEVDQLGMERVKGSPEGAGQSKSHTKGLVLHGPGQSNPNSGYGRAPCCGVLAQAGSLPEAAPASACALTKLPYIMLDFV